MYKFLESYRVCMSGCLRTVHQSSAHLGYNRMSMPAYSANREEMHICQIRVGGADVFPIFSERNPWKIPKHFDMTRMDSQTGQSS